MHKTKPIIWNREVLAYLVGLGLGDGNLSKTNNRSVRLRISCDLRYPFLITEIISAISYILPESKISLVNRKTKSLDICSYSNHWESIMGWKADSGNKFIQNSSVPDWIFYKDEYIKACLKGLLETDGSIYNDRSYTMVMFVNTIPDLAKNVYQMMKWLGFSPRMYDFLPNTRFNSKRIFHVRLSKNVEEFLNLIQPVKA